jgi:hypothetical protein
MLTKSSACGLSGATLAKRAMNDAAVDTDPTRSQVVMITLGYVESSYHSYAGG